MFSAKHGHYWYHFFFRLWYDAVLDWGLNPGPPALEASTIPLGYRGGGDKLNDPRDILKRQSNIEFIRLRIESRRDTPNVSTHTNN